MKYESERSLKLIRINRDSCHLYIGLLQNALPDDQFEQLQKMKINIDLGIVYNNDMRNRIVQLLNNEYKDEEIDTLINRHLLQSMLTNRLLALEMCKYDTSKLFRYPLDSIVKLQKNKRSGDIVIYITVSLM